MVTSITESTTTYMPTAVTSVGSSELKVTIFPNPANDFIAIQIFGLNKEDLKVELYDITGKLLESSSISKGATIAYLDTRTFYSGTYLVKVFGPQGFASKRIVLNK